MEQLPRHDGENFKTESKFLNLVYYYLHCTAALFVISSSSPLTTTRAKLGPASYHLDAMAINLGSITVAVAETPLPSATPIAGGLHVVTNCRENAKEEGENRGGRVLF
jgi:hypothetical protein